MGTIRIALAAIVFAVLAISPATAQVVAVTGKCKTTDSAFTVVTSPEAEILNQQFQNVPGASVSFTQAVRGCVIVLFSAESFAGVGESLMLRPILPGAGASSPATLMFAANDPNLYTTRSAVFVFQNVAAGAHTLRMQARSAGGTQTELRGYTLVVQFRG